MRRGMALLRSFPRTIRTSLSVDRVIESPQVNGADLPSPLCADLPSPLCPREVARNTMQFVCLHCAVASLASRRFLLRSIRLGGSAAVFCRLVVTACISPFTSRVK